MKNKPFLLISLIALFSCSVPVSSQPEPSSENLPIQSSVEAVSSANEAPVSSEESSPSGNYVYQKLKSDSVQSLGASLASSLGLPTLKLLEGELTKNSQNAVVSPASFVLALSGLSSVSKNFPNASFGLSEDASNDVMSLLEAWNFEYHDVHDYGGGGKSEDYCSFEAVVAHQSVGSTYRFDAEKRESFASKYIATIESNLSSYHADAEDFFHNELGYTIPVPDPNLRNDGVITYGGFKMKDYVPGGLGESERLFNSKNTPCYSFGSVYYPLALDYLEGEQYEVFRLQVYRTSLVIVLPKEGVQINNVSPASAYEAFLENGKTVDATGYVPYFHNKAENLNFTNNVKSKLTGNEVFYDSLLKEGCPRDLALTSVLQNNDFEFNQYGVSGESITMMAMEGTAMPTEHQVVTLNVDRPFYAIAEKDHFPLFANKVMEIAS